MEGGSDEEQECEEEEDGAGGEGKLQAAVLPPPIVQLPCGNWFARARVHACVYEDFNGWQNTHIVTAHLAVCS